jgi:hypothetical protein
MNQNLLRCVCLGGLVVGLSMTFAQVDMIQPTTAPAVAPTPITVAASDANPVVDGYENLLRLLGNPPASGALVVQLNPNSTAAAMGVAMGDIIVAYNQMQITQEEQLREAIAEVYANARTQEAQDVLDRRLPLVVVRNGQRITLSVPPRPLGISLLTVKEHVQQRAITPPSPRETWKMAWDKLPLAITTGQVIPRDQIIDYTFQGAPAEREHQRLYRKGEGYVLEVFITEPGRQPNLPTTPQLLMEFTARNPDKDGPALVVNTITTPTMQVIRKGNTLRTFKLSNDPQTPPTPVATLPTVMGAIPSYLISQVAAALPQEQGVVMPVAQISEHDFQTRLGFALATDGEAALPDGKSKGYRVRLVEYQRTVTTFWFNAQRELIFVQHADGLIGKR